MNEGVVCGGDRGESEAGLVWLSGKGKGVCVPWCIGVARRESECGLRYDQRKNKGDV